uniref:ABI family, member 3a n=1 Tax=Lepisosteus oculatus TaxID=7918 RepID=W5N6C1_LEPOC
MKDQNGEEIQTILQEAPSARQALLDNYANLHKVADYCESNYLQVEDTKKALEETKAFTTQSLASVAYQISTMASNVLKLLDAQTAQLRSLESSVNLISQTVDMHREKVSRREIGVFTTVKRMPRNQKIIPPPATPEQKTKYSRTPIAYATLDSVGHGMKDSSKQLGRTGTMNRKQPSREPGGTLGRSTRAPEAVQCPVAPSLTRGPSLSSLNERPSAVKPVALLKVAPLRASSVLCNRQTLITQHYTQSRLCVPSAPGGGATLPVAARGPGFDWGCRRALSPSPPPPRKHVRALLSGLLAHSTPRPPEHWPLLSAQLQQNSLGSKLCNPRQQSVLLPLLPSPPLSVIIPPPPPYPPPLAPLALLTPPLGLAKRLLHLGEWPSPCHPFGPHSEFGTAEPPFKLLLDPSAVALYSYSSSKEDELTFQEGDIIYIIQKGTDGWYTGFFNGVEGYFPGNYVGPAS